MIQLLRFLAALVPLAAGFYVIADARGEIQFTFHDWNHAQLAIGCLPVAFGGYLIVARIRTRDEVEAEDPASG